MADPAIDVLVSRRSFTAERSRKGVCVSPSNREEPPPPKKNKDTRGSKSAKNLGAQTGCTNRVRTATWLVRRR